jgi:hypothetical protein
MIFYFNFLSEQIIFEDQLTLISYDSFDEIFDKYMLNIVYHRNECNIGRIKRRVIVVIDRRISEIFYACHESVFTFPDMLKFDIHANYTLEHNGKLNHVS